MVTESSEEQAVWKLLSAIADPEIPVISLVDLNVVTAVHVEGAAVTVTLRPTFSGCPALEQMRSEVSRVLTEHGFHPVEVRVDHLRTWSTDDLDEGTRKRLRDFGIAPPPRRGSQLAATLQLPVECPHCGSPETTLESAFGSTLCKQIFFCPQCRQSFERFKPL